ncbi:nuclear transport factor 2 family protein [Nakamurella sp.]|uniref:nuclear transport factor 2 family protein n=1 Tax=Nakamurella sp. TaxID=1869182 RepID=UPI003784B372
MTDAHEPRELLARYHQAMIDFDADALAELYAPDCVHEFGFLTPGHAPSYRSREEVRTAYRAAWRSPGVRLLEIHNLAVHETADPAVVVAEWAATGRLPDRGEIGLNGVLVLRAQGGQLTHVRDYMDVLGLAHRTGRLPSLAAALAESEAR